MLALLSPGNVILQVNISSLFLAYLLAIDKLPKLVLSEHLVFPLHYRVFPQIWLLLLFCNLSRLFVLGGAGLSLSFLPLLLGFL